MQGTTDSELTFALFLNQIGDPMGDYTPDDLRKKVIQTIEIIQNFSKKVGTNEPSLLNFAVLSLIIFI